MGYLFVILLISIILIIVYKYVQTSNKHKLEYGDVIRVGEHNSLYYLFIKNDNNALFVKRIPVLINSFQGFGEKFTSTQNLNSLIFIDNVFINFRNLTYSHRITSDEIDIILQQFVSKSDIEILNVQDSSSYDVIYDKHKKIEIENHFKKLEMVVEYDREMIKINHILDTPLDNNNE